MFQKKMMYKGRKTMLRGTIPRKVVSCQAILWKPTSWKLIVGAIFLVLLLTQSVSADTAELEIIGEQEYKAIRLSPEVYNGANQNLSDILILDETGTPVPYFIHSYDMLLQKFPSVAYVLDFVDSYVKSGDTYHDYRIESGEETDIQATSISIETSSEMFAKNIELRGSYDGVTWDFIQNDQLYRVNENEKLTITFGKPLKYTHYRFTIANNTAKAPKSDTVSINSAVLEYSRDSREQVFFTQTMFPSFTTEEQEKTTLIRIYGLKNLRINQMTLQTEDPFKRTVYFAGGLSKTLYNLTFGETLYRDTSLDFNGFSEKTDVLEVRISNGDDKPIHIQGITLSYFTDEVIFKGESGKRYTLSFGDPSILAAPVYDIVNYKDLILNQGYDVLGVYVVQAAQTDTPEPKPDYSMVFNILVVAISLLLAFIILVRLRKTGR